MPNWASPRSWLFSIASRLRVDADGPLQLPLLAGHLGQLQQGGVHELAVGELALQTLAHGGGQVQLVHLEIDLPELDVGFFQHPAAELAGRRLADLLADLQGLLILGVGVLS